MQLEAGLTHCWSSGKLSESHLLAGLGRDRLGQEGSRWPGVELAQETPNTRLSPSGELLVEVHIASNISEGTSVVVGTLLCGSRSEDVGQELGMSSLLVCHELEQTTLVGVDAGVFKLCHGECLQAIVEEIKLDPLLIETEVERGVVEIRDGSVAWVGDGVVTRGIDDGDLRGEVMDYVSLENEVIC